MKNITSIERLKGLYGPYKKFPIAFVDYPHVCELLDAIPALLDVAEATRDAVAYTPHKNECSSKSGFHCICWQSKVKKALANLEALP